MTLRDNLEIGLKKDAEFRKDNLPESQVRGPEIPAAKHEAEAAAEERSEDGPPEIQKA